MKTRIKKCLICFRITAGGTKKCEHCGVEFRSGNRKTWLTKLKDLVGFPTHGRD